MMSLKTKAVWVAAIGGAICLIGILAVILLKHPSSQASADPRKAAVSAQEKAGAPTPSTKAPLNAATRQQLMIMGDQYGRNGDWKKAHECFRQIVPFGMQNEREWSLATASALADGDTQACEKYCEQMMAAYGQGNDPNRAERCAKQCLGLPDCSDELFEQAAERADFAYSADRNNRWRQLVKGMAEYRRGNWTGALDSLRQPEGSSDLEVGIQALCVAAMARQKLGELARAKEALEQVKSRVWVLIHTGYLANQRHNSWDNIARAMALRAEAEQLIYGKQVSAPLDPQTISANRQKWENVALYLEAADHLARQSAWFQASEYYSKAMQDPRFDWQVFEIKNDYLAQQIAAAFLMADDQSKYRELVRVLLDRKAETLSSLTRERYAQVCVSNPGALAPEIRSRAVALARQVYEQPQAGANPWLCLLRGITEYREGRLTEAVESLEQASFKPEDTVAQAWAVTYRALAYKKLGRAQEAAQATQEASSLFARQTSRKAPWPHAAYYELAMKELLGMLSNADKSTPSPK